MTPKLRKWLLANGGFLAILYAGLLTGLPWLTYSAAAIVWSCLAMYTVVFISSNARSHAEPAPRWLGLAVDSAALVGLALSGLYITTCAYVVSMLLLLAVYARGGDGASEPDDGDTLRRELKIAGDAAEYVTGMLKRSTEMLSFRFDRVPNDQRADLLLGFIGSAADVVAQSMGAAPGGTGSINATLRILQAFFDERQSESHFTRMWRLQERGTPDFEEGVNFGNLWANALLHRETGPATAATLAVFLKHYDYCCEPPAMSRGLLNG